MKKQVQKKITVLAFGTFDLLHPGHRYFLRAAAKLGSKLTVVVARDKNVKKIKKHFPTHNEQTRLRAIRALPYVTRAILGQPNLNHRYALIKKNKPDIIALGYDQKPAINILKRELKLIRLSPRLLRISAHKPKHFKSSILRKTKP